MYPSYNIINWYNSPNTQFCVILFIFLHENMGQLFLRLSKNIIYLSFSFVFPIFKKYIHMYIPGRTWTETHKGNFLLRFQTDYYAVRQVEFFPKCDYVTAQRMLPGGNVTSTNSLMHPFFRHILIEWHWKIHTWGWSLDELLQSGLGPKSKTAPTEWPHSWTICPYFLDMSECW